MSDEKDKPGVDRLRVIFGFIGRNDYSVNTDWCCYRSGIERIKTVVSDSGLKEISVDLLQTNTGWHLNDEEYAQSAKDLVKYIRESGIVAVGLEIIDDEEVEALAAKLYEANPGDECPWSPGTFQTPGQSADDYKVMAKAAIRHVKGNTADFRRQKMAQTWSNFYESLDEIVSEDGVARLLAGFTPNNGIRIRIAEKDDEVDQYAEYDFTEDQAEHIGQALIRWAQRSRAEGELMRCKMSPLHRSE